MTHSPVSSIVPDDTFNHMNHHIENFRPRRAIAVVSPYDMVLDYELYRWTPLDYALYMTRTPYLDLPVTVDMVRRVSAPEDVEEVAKTVLVPEPDGALYACTSGSFCRGAQAERALAEAVSRGSRAPAYTTSGAVVEALRALNVNTISLVTPYTSDITDLFVSFLEEYGITVVHSASLELQRRIWEIEPETALQMLKKADSPDAQALVVSCTNFPTFDMISRAEQLFGKPVVSANGASMWAVTGLAGGQVRGTGTLARTPYVNTMARSTPVARQWHQDQPKERV